MVVGMSRQLFPFAWKDGRNTPDTLFLVFGDLVCAYPMVHATPRAVPMAARMADARFHRNLIILALFSCVMVMFFLGDCFSLNANFREFIVDIFNVHAR